MKTAIKTLLVTATAVSSMAVSIGVSSASVPPPVCPGGTGAGGVTVYTGSGVGGAPAIVGVCDPALGYIEVDSSHVVAQGNQFGYVGVSGYESGTHGCTPANSHDGTEGGSGSNGGGCYGTNDTYVDLRGGAVVVNDGQVATLPVTVPQAVPLPVCGDGTGPFTGSSRDGCRVDNADANDLVNEILALVP